MSIPHPPTSQVGKSGLSKGLKEGPWNGEAWPIQALWSLTSSEGNICPPLTTQVPEQLVAKGYRDWLVPTSCTALKWRSSVATGPLWAVLWPKEKKKNQHIGPHSSAQALRIHSIIKYNDRKGTLLLSGTPSLFYRWGLPREGRRFARVTEPLREKLKLESPSLFSHDQPQDHFLGHTQRKLCLKEKRIKGSRPHSGKNTEARHTSALQHFNWGLRRSQSSDPPPPPPPQLSPHAELNPSMSTH